MEKELGLRKNKDELQHCDTSHFHILVQPTFAEPTTLTGSASCDFDGDLCSYVQDVADDFNWARITGATTSTNTGPSNDHTSGSGKFNNLRPKINEGSSIPGHGLNSIIIWVGPLKCS